MMRLDQKAGTHTSACDEGSAAYGVTTAPCRESVREHAVQAVVEQFCCPFI